MGVRFCYDSWEEEIKDIKNSMLDYSTEILEDANDFSWQHMSYYVGWGRERLNGLRPPKLIKRFPSQTSCITRKHKDNCHFYQMDMCQNQKDHETGGTFYKHICATCFTMGKAYITHG